MKGFRIWGKVFVRASWQRPLLLLASLGGVAAGTGILCALNLANGRALRAFEASARGLTGPVSEASSRGLSVQWRSPTGKMSQKELQACQAEAPAGLRCRGVVTRPAKTREGWEVQLVGLSGTPELAAAPLFSEALRERTGRVTLPGLSEGIEAQGTFPGADLAIVLSAEEVMAVTQEGSAPAPGRGLDWIEAEWSKEDFAQGKEAFEAVLKRVEARFERPINRTTAEKVIASTQALTATYRFNLNVLGWMSILVGALLVSNVAALYSLIKRPTVAVLRQLGATRGQVLALVLGEQVFLGLSGGALGLALGLALERAVSGEVLRTLSSIYMQRAATRAELSPGVAVATVLAGALIYVVAGLGSTWKLLRVQPASLGRRLLDEGPRARLPWLIPAICLALVVASPAVPPISVPFLGLDAGAGIDAPQPMAGYVAALGIFVLAFAWAGAALGGVARAVRWLTPSRVASRLPSWAVAARRGARSGLRGRAQVATLAGGLSLVVGVALMVGGFRVSLTRWLEAAFAAEVVGEPLEVHLGEARPRLREADLVRLRGLPSVEGVDCLLVGDWVHRGRPVKVAGIEDALPPGRNAPFVPWILPPGINAADTLRRMFKDPSLALQSETFVRKHGGGPGTFIDADLLGNGKPYHFEIIGTVREFSSDAGYLLVQRQAYAKWTGQDGCNNVRLYLKSGAALDAPARELRAIDPKAADRVKLYSGVELRKNVLRTFDETFAVTDVLSVLAAFLGGLSLLTQLMQSTAERMPEWLALRRLGVNWAGLLRLCAADIGLAVLGGVALGLVCGGLLGWVLCYSINLQAFGWTVDYGSPAAFLRIAKVSGIFAAVLLALGVVLAWGVLRPGERWRVVRE